MYIKKKSAYAKFYIYAGHFLWYQGQKKEENLDSRYNFSRWPNEKRIKYNDKLEI